MSTTPIPTLLDRAAARLSALGLTEATDIRVSTVGLHVWLPLPALEALTLRLDLDARLAEGVAWVTVAPDVTLSAWTVPPVVVL